MKLKFLFSFFSVMLLFFTSCDNSSSPNIDGKWEDNIKLSKKEAHISASSNTVTITTQGDGWWLESIRLNNEGLDLSKMNRLAKDFVVTNPEFQVERKGGKTIIITMNANTTNADRTFYVGLEDGDYFDGIAVIQSK